MAAVDSARRWVVFPVDMAYVTPGQSGVGALEPTAAPEGSVPPVVLLGQDDGSRVFFRFAWRAPPGIDVLEAYLVMPRARDAAADAQPIALRAVYVKEPWRGSAVTWARQPLVRESDAPITRVSPGGPEMVRLDVKRLVERWLERPRDAFGLAVVGSTNSGAGLAFALEPAADALRESPVLDAFGPGPVSVTAHPGRLLGQEAISRESTRRASAGPWLEVYSK